jgi:tetratricopeptide (TPR) repeat protein
MCDRNPDRATYLNNLGWRLGRRYERAGEIADLDEAIAITRRTIDSTPDYYPNRAGRLNCLAAFLERRYDRTGEMADLDEGIGITRRAISLTPDEHSNWATYLRNLEIKLGRRYERRGEIADLDEAIRLGRRAIGLTPDDYPDRVDWLRNAFFLERRYERRGEIADLDEAIGLTRRAIDSTTDDHPDRAVWLSKLGNTLHRRYDRTGEMADLDEAIGLMRRSIALTPNGYPERADWLNNLGNTLGRRYERLGEMADLDEAIGLMKRAIDSTPDDGLDRATSLSNLAALIRHRYGRTGEIPDLDEAIGLGRRAIDLAPDDYPDLAGRLSNLAVFLERRYDRTGEMADLDEGIDLARRAVDSSLDDHPDWADWLNNLGNGLGLRYERLGEMADLDEAIRLGRRAIDLAPDDHRNRADWLSNLASSLGGRYKRTGQMADLEEAISLMRLAIGLTPDNHPKRAASLISLGIQLCQWYGQTGKIADIDEAIGIGRRAINLTPNDHPDLTAYLNNLAIFIESRYNRTGEMADLDEAIDLARRAVNSTPDDHPDRAGWLNNLGTGLESQYERTGETRLLEEASLTLQNAWHYQTGIPFHRVKAGARCLKLLALQHETDIAINLGKNIIDLLPSVNTRFLDRSDQQFVLSTFSGVAADLCAFLLQSNQPADAIRFLEKGRAVIIGQLMDARSDLSILQQQHPDIAHRYQQLRDEVNTPFRQVEQGAIQRQTRTRRLEALTELDACIQEIRGITGHERFMLGQEPEEMQECAEGGSIVVVNVTTFRSDAIIVSSTAIKSLNLPQLAAKDAMLWLAKKWTGRRSERAQKNREYLQYLSWLWEACVKQILDEVYHSHEGIDDLPRIWWIGTGLASSMPFHAAGRHSADSTENALSRAISSYAPSIKALAHARRRAKVTESTQGSLLVATMPTTPGNALCPDLPGVEEERKQLVGAVGDHLAITHLELPSVKEVAKSLQNCCIAHFACHGFTDHLDPSKSGLVLQNQGEEDRLTVQKVSELSLRNARMAYLSACSTAENKAARLSDEVIHVVSGFQVAGFPHVIGCLWPSIDRICVDVAGRFYLSLLEGKTGCWDGREVASALRDAVMEVRKNELRMPLAWAQFVHFGA